MVCLLFMLWFLIYFVRVDAERHRNLLYETQEFALEFHKLPKLKQDYSAEVLKAELWEHIQKVIWDEPHKIEKLRDMMVDKSCDIVDI